MRVPWNNVGEGLGLVLALAFVFSAMFIPHLDTFGDEQGLDEDDPGIFNLAEASWQYWVTDEREGYPYTIHVDANVHWNYIAAVQDTDSVFVDWVSGDEHEQEGFFSLRGAVHERGYHVLFAEVQELTGVSWKTLLHYLPAAWMAFAAFGIYAMLRPHPAAVPAAALVGLVPSSPRFLGPALFVPIAFSLAWLPATQILAKPGRRKASSALLVFTVALWAFFVHLIGGFAAVGVLLVGGLLGTAAQRRRALSLLAAGLIPLVWLYRSFSTGVQAEIDRIGDLPVDFTIFDGFGLWALGLWAIGCVLVALVAQERDEESVIPTWAGVSMGALAMILSSVVFFEERPYATYDRWHPVFFFAATVPAGFAVATAGGLARDAVAAYLPQRRHVAKLAPALGAIAALLLLSTAASQGVGHQLDQPYYHVMDDETWADYTWIRDNVGDEYEVFLAEPWQAPMLSAMTDKTPHAFLAPGDPPVNGEDYVEYARTGSSLEFFIANDVTLVATSGKPPFEVYETPHDGVHTMDAEVTAEIAEIRAMERD